MEAPAARAEPVADGKGGYTADFSVGVSRSTSQLGNNSAGGPGAGGPGGPPPGTTTTTTFAGTAVPEAPPITETTR